MDPRMNRILQNRDKMLIGIDDTFQFNCNQCGKCCMNREDILCTPKDVFRISKMLGISTYDFIKKYCDSYLGDTSHMPIVRIVPHDAAGHCPLLENNKCVVHECKPVVCAMYPIGRTICIDTSVKDPKDMNVKDIEYLFTHPIRCGKTEKHTVREWLTQFGIPIEDEYFIQWHKTISILSPLIQKAITKIRVDSMNQILNIIFVKLYMEEECISPLQPMISIDLQVSARPITFISTLLWMSFWSCA